MVVFLFFMEHFRDPNNVHSEKAQFIFPNQDNLQAVKSSFEKTLENLDNFEMSPNQPADENEIELYYYTGS